MLNVLKDLVNLQSELARLPQDDKFAGLRTAVADLVVSVLELSGKEPKEAIAEEVFGKVTMVPADESVAKPQWGDNGKRYVANLTDKIKQGTNYVGMFCGIYGDFHIVKVVDTNNQLADGYALYSTKHGRYSNYIHETELECMEDKDLYFKKYDMRTFVDLDLFLKMNKKDWTGAVEKKYRYKGRCCKIIRLKDVKKEEYWYGVEDDLKGDISIRNTVFKTILLAEQHFKGLVDSVN